VSGNVRLHEDGRYIRVNTRRDVQRRHFAGFVAQLGGILGHGDGMHVHHAEVALIAVLFLHPLAERPKIVADGQVAGRLDT